MSRVGADPLGFWRTSRISLLVSVYPLRRGELLIGRCHLRWLALVAERPADHHFPHHATRNQAESLGTMW